MTKWNDPAPWTIRNRTGQYYTGCTGPKTWSDDRFDAFTYTLNGAHYRIESCPIAFTNCTIEKG